MTLFLLGDEASHALVNFPDEKQTCVVPASRLLCDVTLLKVGDKVDVQWSKQKIYSAQLLLLGNIYLVKFFIAVGIFRK